MVEEGDEEGCEGVRGVMVTMEGLEGALEGALKSGSVGGLLAVLVEAVLVGKGAGRVGVEGDG